MHSLVALVARLILLIVLVGLFVSGAALVFVMPAAIVTTSAGAWFLNR